MAGIRILPEVLSNQIAAGEVVERPASVVKELVENCLDAHANSILVETGNGGKSLIRVSDNGQGMSRDDALLSIERYATSKIYTPEDLFSIATMGFRGEALPSIASVSKLTLITRTAESDVATKIEMAGGKLVNVSDAGAPVGTLVEVRQLFYNTPARRKFLKSENTEGSYIADTVLGIALGNPFIQFRLFSGSQLLRNFSAGEDALARALNVLGRAVHDRLYPIGYSSKAISVSGFVSNPMVTRSTASRMYLYVNRRLVRDRGLISAVFDGYGGRMMKQRFPYVVIFLDLLPDQVDVNVHPAKREVRFADSQEVYQAVREAVASGLTAAEKKNTGYARAAAFENLNSNPDPSDDPKIQSPRFELNSRPKPVHEPDLPFQRADHPGSGPASSGLLYENDLSERIPLINKPDTVDEAPGCPWESGSTDSTVIVGQVMGTYIIAESTRGVILIDQHAAHERIVYEKLKKRFKTLSATSQDLVIPETIDIGFREADLLSRMLDDFAAIGIRIEPFGGTTFVIRSIPGIIDQKNVSALVLDILDSQQDSAGLLSREKWLDECLAKMACHDAIRANHALTVPEMKKLVYDLEQCDQPMHCPHGRPVMLLWEQSTLEKMFKRIV